MPKHFPPHYRESPDKSSVNPIKNQSKKHQVRVGITWCFVALQPTRALVSAKRRG